MADLVPSPRWPRVLAWGLWIVVAGLVLMSTALAVTGALGDDGPAALYALAFVLLPASYGTVGATIAAQRPDHDAGWLLLAIGLLFGIFSLGSLYGAAGLGASPPLPAAVIAAWSSTWILVVVLGLSGIFLLTFPDGRLPGRRWRWALYLTVGATAAGALGTAVDPGSLSEGYDGLPNPIGVGPELGPSAELLATIGTLGIMFGFGAGVASLVIRYRRAGMVERLQIKWITFVGFGALAMLPIAVLAPFEVGGYALLLAFAFIAALPVAVAFAILRYRLLEIDRLISRTFVFGALTAILAGLYAASMRLFQDLFVALTGDESDAAIVITTLILATTLTPIKSALERFARDHFDDPTPPAPTEQDAAAPGVGTPERRRALSLDDPADVAALEALVERVITRHSVSG